MGRVSALRATAGLSLAAWLLGACATPGPAEPDRFYRLEPQVAVERSPSPVRATLRVSPLAARGFVGGRQIVYRSDQDPAQVRRHDHHLWEQPPALAVGEALADALRAARLFELVVDRSARARADYVLDGTLQRFEQLTSTQSHRVLVAFDLVLVDARERRARSLGRYRGEEVMDAVTPTAMVAAFNHLTGRLINAAVRDIAALRPQLDPSRAP